MAPKPGARFHWHDEDDKRRTKAINLIVDLGVVHIVVAAQPLEGSKQERARRLCMHRLLVELEMLGVSQVRMDSRRPVQNASDIRVVNGFRKSRLIGNAIRIDHIG